MKKNQIDLKRIVRPGIGVIGGFILVSMLSASKSASALEALPKAVPTPKENPQTAAKIELGKQLFFDPRLS